MMKAAAMATIGMMTAIAIFPPELRPPEPPEPEPDALKAEGVGDVRELVVSPPLVGKLEVSGCCVDVTTMTEGLVGVGVVGSAGGGVMVVVVVTSMTLSDVVGGGTMVVEGGSEVIDVMVVGGSGGGVVVGSSGVVVEVSVMVMVVVGEVVKLTDVVVMVVMVTESVAGSLVVGTAESVVLSVEKLETAVEVISFMNIPAIVRSEGEGKQFASSGRVGSLMRGELDSPALRGRLETQRKRFGSRKRDGKMYVGRYYGRRALN